MREVAVAATGLLADAMAAGYIGLADFHVAERLAVHIGERAELPRLALAVAVRELRRGSVCVTLDDLAALEPDSDDDQDATALAWPPAAAWRAALEQTTLVTLGADADSGRPLRLVGQRLYLERYWQAERSVGQRLAELRDSVPAPLPRRETDPNLNDEQLAAVDAVSAHRVSVVTGGPGTGKTRNVAGILMAYRDLPLVALAAPTGKAAARLEESVASEVGDGVPVPVGTTLHRLLGMHPSRPHSATRNATNPLPHDLVVIDETSMLPLTTMRLLLDALSGRARIVFLGDADQLASVDAGAVLADLVDAGHLLGAGALTRLVRNYRFGSGIHTVAEAIRTGDADACLAALGASADARLVDVEPVLPGPMLDWATALRDAALVGDAAGAAEALDAHRVLCAHRDGPYGARRWNQLIRRSLAGAIPGYGTEHGSYLGQPILIGTNSISAGRDAVWNGDTGVIIATPEGHRAAISRGSAPLIVAPELLNDVSEMFAMTIHKSQGSQFDHVTVILPPLDSPLLTRELVYTAVTRAKKSVTIHGSPQALVRAIETPARRASGLAFTT